MPQRAILFFNETSSLLRFLYFHSDGYYLFQTITTGT